MAQEVRILPGEFGPGLLRAGRADWAAHGGDAIGRKHYVPGVFLHGRLVRGEADAVHLVAGYVAIEPLDLGPHFSQYLDRLLGDFSHLGVG